MPPPSEEVRLRAVPCRLRWRRSSLRGHSFGTTTCWPADSPAGHLDQPVGVVEKPSVTGTEMTGAVRRPRLRPRNRPADGEQRVDGHDEGVIHGGGRDGDLDTGAWSRAPVAAGSLERMSTLIVAAEPPEPPELPELIALPEPADPEPLPDGRVGDRPDRCHHAGVVCLSGRADRHPVAGVDLGLLGRVELGGDLPGGGGCLQHERPGWAGAPSVADTLVTLTAVGRNTA